MKIAILGAESTGKTTLAAALHKAVGGVIVPEVLRAWVDYQGRVPKRHEQRHIFEAQIARETEACALGVTPVLCDTTPLSIALNSVLYFDDDSLLPEAIAHQRSYSHALLCLPDFPWVPDGLQRDSPQMQARFHARLIDTLHTHALPYTPVAGQGAAREARAIATVQWWLES